MTSGRSTPPADPPWRTLSPAVRGAALICAAVFLMALQDAIVKRASADLPLWQVYVLRSLLALPLIAAAALLERRRAALWRRSFGRWTLARAFLLVAMYVALYAALPDLDLSVVAAGFYTGPLFITLLSAWLLREAVTARAWLAVAVGFTGVLIMLRPGTDGFRPMALLPVLSGLCYALAAVTTRSRCREEAPLTLTLSLNSALLVTGLVMSGVVLAWGPMSHQTAVNPFLLSPWSAMDTMAWLLVGGLAALTIGIGVGLAGAYQVAPPVVVAAFDYSYLVFASFWGFVFFAEIPDMTTVAGMVCIAAGGYLVLPRRP